LFQLQFLRELELDLKLELEYIAYEQVEEWIVDGDKS
jgi:hypothetical protein